ncbi:MAG: type II toxin-antitoxin system HicA family toxin [Clostridia bacterium]|nr:type II toxin-antitoxin system HicA family toxin [Clostridia bacterium]
MRAKELIKLLKQNGWHEVSQKGSHLKMKKGEQTEIIPIHSRRYSNRNSECNIKESRFEIIFVGTAYNIEHRGDKMNKVSIYPAIFSYDKKENCYLVDFIDLKGCSTFGKTLVEAFEMAQDAMGLYLDELDKMPEATSDFSNIKLNKNEFINYVSIDMNEYRRKNNNKAIKKTLTIPCWLNNLSERNNINFSQVLQEALKERLGISE